MATTSSERGLTLRSPGRFVATVARLIELGRAQGALGDPQVRDTLARAWIDAEAYRLYTLRDVTDIVEGRSPGARSSLNKLWWSELDVRLQTAALDLLGPLGETDVSETAARAAESGGSGWMKSYQFSLSGPIYAGTNEIQRNIVAERVLGLPRK